VSLWPKPFCPVSPSLGLNRDCFCQHHFQTLSPNFKFILDARFNLAAKCCGNRFVSVLFRTQSGLHVPRYPGDDAGLIFKRSPPSFTHLKMLTCRNLCHRGLNRFFWFLLRYFNALSRVLVLALRCHSVTSPPALPRISSILSWLYFFMAGQKLSLIWGRYGF